MGRLKKVLITIATIVTFVQFRKLDGFWYLYRCPHCNRRSVYKKWINEADPRCEEETCKTVLIRVL